MQKAINESNLNGHEWKVTTDGLSWSYLDGEQFTFVERDEFIVVRDSAGKRFCFVAYSESDSFADCKTLTEAYYLVALATISKANYLY